MTVTINNVGYKDASRSSFASTKPYARSLDSDGEMENMLNGYRRALISIYELKDILDPGGRC